MALLAFVIPTKEGSHQHHTGSFNSDEGGVYTLKSVKGFIVFSEKKCMHVLLFIFE